MKKIEISDDVYVYIIRPLKRILLTFSISGIFVFLGIWLHWILMFFIAFMNAVIMFTWYTAFSDDDELL